MAPKKETHVWANFGEGKVLGHKLDGGHENAAGETKYLVQAPNGHAYDLAYREPEDDDDQGSGMTFWNFS